MKKISRIFLTVVLIIALGSSIMGDDTQKVVSSADKAPVKVSSVNSGTASSNTESSGDTGSGSSSSDTGDTGTDSSSSDTGDTGTDSSSSDTGDTGTGSVSGTVSDPVEKVTEKEAVAISKDNSKTDTGSGSDDDDEKITEDDNLSENDTSTVSLSPGENAEVIEEKTQMQKPEGSVSEPSEILKISRDEQAVSKDTAAVKKSEKVIFYDSLAGNWHIKEIPTRSGTTGKTPEASGSDDRIDRGSEIIISDETKKVLYNKKLTGYSISEIKKNINNYPAIRNFIKIHARFAVDYWYNRLGEVVVQAYDIKDNKEETVLVEPSTKNQITERGIANSGQVFDLVKNEQKIMEFLKNYPRANKTIIYDRQNHLWLMTLSAAGKEINAIIDADSGKMISVNELDYKNIKDNFR